ncbi:hypothetical protein Efla_004637 [Eimeria flavescens]
MNTTIQPTPSPRFVPSVEESPINSTPAAVENDLIASVTTRPSHIPTSQPDSHTTTPQLMVHQQRRRHATETTCDLPQDVAGSGASHPRDISKFHVYLPSALNGVWGQAQVAELEDTGDFQRTLVCAGAAVGSQQWREALERCQTYKRTALEAAANNAEPVVSAATPPAGSCYPKRRGHMGFAETYQQLVLIFYREGVKEFVKKYGGTCVRRQATKAIRQCAAGLLRSLAILARRWDTIAMDFITGRPRTPSGNDAVLVVVDRLTERPHFIPLPVTAMAADVAKLFIREVVRLHGVRSSITTDRNARFVSQFWEEFPFSC